MPVTNDDGREERESLRRGGQDALGELFVRYRPRLERIVAFRLDPRIQGRFDPADILQEAYLEMAKRLEDYLASSSLSPFVWMRQLTLQTMIDLHRAHFSQKRDANRETRYLAPMDGQTTSLSIARFLLAEMTSPSQAAVDAEESDRLQLALESMQEIDREVLALRHFEHLNNRQVAEVLGLSTTAASNRYIRAAARLSEIIRDVGSRQEKRGFCP